MDEKSVKIEGNSLLIFGGVYSNVEALLAVNKIAVERGFSKDQVICTGDVTAYCANPKECLDFIADWGIHCIAGNVELQLRANENDCGCNFNEASSCDIHSRQWYPFVQSQIGGKQMDWMQTLPERMVIDFGGKRWGIVHGSASEIARFVYKSTPWAEKLAEFERMNVDHIIGGHCGIPFIDSKDGKSWINSGALGMPANDGTPHVWYTTIDKTESGFDVQFHALEYDYLAQQEKMNALKLPKVYADTLSTGIWDSTEVLRPEEVALTGQRITLDEHVFEIG